MIIRNEASALPACLRSLRPWVDEICVVDTGSVDRSVEIARSFQAKVESFAWCDDFSAARNASLAMATQEWILVVDADETLTEASGPILRELIKGQDAAYLVSQDNLDRHGAVHPRMIARLFRNHRGIAFRRKVHESVSDSLADLGLSTCLRSGLHLRHEGYLPEAIAARDKRARNMRILEAEIEESPEDLYSLHKLGMMLPALAPERCVLYKRATAIAHHMSAVRREQYPYLPRIYANYAAALSCQGKLSKSAKVIDRGMERFPDNVELLFQQADLAQRVGKFGSAARLFGKCLESPSPPPHYPADPRVRGLGAAIALSRVAMRAGDFALTVHALRVVEELDATNPAARAISLRLLLITGQGEALTQELQASLATDLAGAADIQVLAGDVAWTQGDPGSATAMWEIAKTSPEVGRQAITRLAMAAACLPGGSQGENLVDWDTEAASCRLCLAMLVGAEVAFDAAFDQGALLAAVIPWLHMISDAGRSDLLEQFSARAGGYSQLVPGIDRLIQHSS